MTSVGTGEWNKATLVNNIVRVDEANNDLVRVVLEAHYFFTPDANFMGLTQYQWGHGPFVAILPGREKVIDAWGLGYMIGLRNQIVTYTEKGEPIVKWLPTSWNFGVAFMLDSKSKILGDGIRPNEPLPVGETAIRYKETSQGGVMFVTSFSFN